jgi:3-dehydroquinate synthase
VPAIVEFYSLVSLLQNSSGKHFVLCDENTYKDCYKTFCKLIGLNIQSIVIKEGESQKNLDTCEYVWQTLLDEQAGRDALLINLGGGVVSDIGGFVAATYKRGIKYVNVPTSLLAMVDAATGGKTGVNFRGLKNIIGVIQPPELVIIHTPFLKTLPNQHLKNGFAEMLKHALLDGSEELHLLINNVDTHAFYNDDIILKSLAIKEAIVAQDPNEIGLRKILNLGHTIGHAIEFAAKEIGNNILHGHAVALGIVAALKLSVTKLNFNQNEAGAIIDFIRKHYPTPTWLNICHKAILNAVLQDKKNNDQQIKMVLLKAIGQPVYDVSCTLQEIENVLMEI